MTDTARLPLPSLPTLLRRTMVPLAIVAQLLLLAPIALLPQAAHAADGPVVAPPAITAFGDWAPAECPRPSGEDPTPVRRLVVHHTHEPVAHTIDDVLPALALTCKAHTDRGFSTIGYHYVVDPWGGIYQGRGGMPDEHGNPPATHGQGAHVAGSNAGAVGVVFLGDHQDAPPTAAALDSATRLLAWLLQDTGQDPGGTVPSTSSGVGTARFVGTFEPRAVTGHSASNHTECPGEHLRQLLSPIRDRMRQLLRGEEPTGWAGLAADPAAGEQVVVAEPAADAAPASKPAVKKAPAPVKADDAKAPETGAKVPAPVTAARSSLTSASPVLSAADKLAGVLRGAGLGSLADRFGSSATG